VPGTTRHLPRTTTLAHVPILSLPSVAALVLHLRRRRRDFGHIQVDFGPAAWACSAPPRTIAHSALRASFPLARARRRLPRASRARRPRHSLLLRPSKAAHASHQLAKLLEVVLREVLASANFGDPAVEVCAHLRACLGGRAGDLSVVLRLSPPLVTETHSSLARSALEMAPPTNLGT